MLLLLLATLGLPVLGYGLWPLIPALGSLPHVEARGSVFELAGSVRFARESVGPPPGGLPAITNVQVIDFDGDGRNEVLACDAQRNSVLLSRRTRDGDWDERVLGEDLSAPAHATVCDLDGDGDRDVLVAVLGQLDPSDEVIGQVVWLEQTPTRFARHLILDDVRRVADVQPGDFDGDGDLDLAVAVFGYSRGQVLWLENRGNGRFREHELHSAPGTIHVPVADYDADGDPDIAAIVTQDEEEVWVFENAGAGRFQKRLIHRWFNFDIGGAGLVSADLDSDGDPDLIVPVGDNLEDLEPYPQPYHGCFWLENRGNWDFEPRRIATFGGTYAAAVGDLNGDGHRDVVLVSMANNWRMPGAASVIWLENDGRQNFQPRHIDDEPTHLVSVSCGDLDGDGAADVVAGGLHLRRPYDRLGRITAWMNGGPPK